MGQLRAFTFLILSTLFAQAAHCVSLYVWNTPQTLAPLIIPVREGERPQEAAERYLNHIKQNPDLRLLFQDNFPELDMRDIRPLTGERETRALMMANLPKDYTKDSLRIQNFKRIFAESRHSSYILPISVELGLNSQEIARFNDLLAEKFPLLVALGGQDVTPDLYNEANTHSRDIVPERDQKEMSRIQAYVQKAKGFLFAVCRGSQISAVAMGYKMVQDVPTHVEKHIPHGNDWHDIEVKKTTHNILSALTQNGRLHVNSLHHQAVVYKEGGPLELAAVSPDGVTEATEFKNGKGLLLQFHPELMDNELGSKIIKQAVNQKIKVVPRSCSKVLH